MSGDYLYKSSGFSFKLISVLGGTLLDDSSSRLISLFGDSSCFKTLKLLNNNNFFSSSLTSSTDSSKVSDPFLANFV